MRSTPASLAMDTLLPLCLCLCAGVQGEAYELRGAQASIQACPRLNSMRLVRLSLDTCIQHRHRG